MAMSCPILSLDKNHKYTAPPQCPNNGVGEDFLTRLPIFFYENKIWGLNKHQEKKRPNLAQKCIIGHFGPNIGIFVGWLVGGCGTQSVSRKIPIYFMNTLMNIIEYPWRQQNRHLCIWCLYPLTNPSLSPPCDCHPTRSFSRS